MAHCPKCKKDLPDEANYCLYCGFQIVHGDNNKAITTQTSSSTDSKDSKLKFDLFLYGIGTAVGLIMLLLSLVSQEISLLGIALGALLLIVGGAGLIVTRIRIWWSRR